MLSGTPNCGPPVADESHAAQRPCEWRQAALPTAWWVGEYSDSLTQELPQHKYCPPLLTPGGIWCYDGGMATTHIHTNYKRSEDIVPGDIIDFCGTPHLIVEVEPYTHSTLGEMVGIAKAADGWGITLCPNTLIAVAGDQS